MLQKIIPFNDVCIEAGDWKTSKHQGVQATKIPGMQSFPAGAFEVWSYCRAQHRYWREGTESLGKESCRNCTEKR